MFSYSNIIPLINVKNLCMYHGFPVPCVFFKTSPINVENLWNGDKNPDEGSQWWTGQILIWCELQPFVPSFHSSIHVFLFWLSCGVCRSMVDIDISASRFDSLQKTWPSDSPIRPGRDEVTAHRWMFDGWFSSPGPGYPGYQFWMANVMGSTGQPRWRGSQAKLPLLTDEDLVLVKKNEGRTSKSAGFFPSLSKHGGVLLSRWE